MAIGDPYSDMPNHSTYKSVNKAGFDEFEKNSNFVRY